MEADDAKLAMALEHDFIIEERGIDLLEEESVKEQRKILAQIEREKKRKKREGTGWKEVSPKKKKKKKRKKKRAKKQSASKHKETPTGLEVTVEDVLREQRELQGGARRPPPPLSVWFLR